MGRADRRWTPEEFAALQAKQRTWADRKVASLVVDHPLNATPVVSQKPAEVSDKPRFRSKLEARFAQLLDLRQHAGDIQSWEYEAWTYTFPGRIRLTLDFSVLALDGLTEFYECKGWMRDTARIKLRMFSARHPQIRLYIVGKNLIPKPIICPDDVPRGGNWA